MKNHAIHKYRWKVTNQTDKIHKQEKTWFFNKMAVNGNDIERSEELIRVHIDKHELRQAKDLKTRNNDNKHNDNCVITQSFSHAWKYTSQRNTAAISTSHENKHKQIMYNYKLNTCSNN